VFHLVQVRAGVKLRPTTEREKLYHLVLELRKEGLSYNQIIRKIQTDHGVTLRKSHLSDWVGGRHRPFGYVRAFDSTPSPELGYVIGVSLGDGSTSVSKNYNYKIKLRVIDKEFAEEFSRCLGVILGRNPPRVKWQEKTHSWHTELSSMLLWNFLRQPLTELARIVRYNKACTASFLRGFFDSEAGISGRTLRVSNGDKDLLSLVCDLLESTRIETTGIHVTKKAGGLVLIKGKYYRQNLDQMYVYVRKRSLGAFRESVGFTIRRKALALDSALRYFVPGEGDEK
jgi:intein-encoded DNA endonuclease-like protein